LTTSRQVDRSSAVTVLPERDLVAEAALAKIGTISAILDSSTIGIAICDKALRCAAANHIFASLRGATVAGHAGKSIVEVVGGDTSRFAAAFQRVWQSGRPMSEVELRTSDPGRTESMCFAVNLRPIKNAFGAMCFIAAIFSDFTARKKLERRLTDLVAASETKLTRRAQRRKNEYAEVPAESARTLRRGIEMLVCSSVVRCHLSEIRIANALLSGSLFLALERDSERTYQDALSRMVSVENHNAGIDVAIGAPTDAKAPTPRERQIVQLLVEGKANKEIAEILALSTRTVEGYRAKLMEKLDLHSVGELVRYAFRNHIVEM
jgi:DNA-binding CsgD family transcriptional regulator